MAFGKPKLSTTQKVRCISCSKEYSEAEIELEHAGRIEVAEASASTEPGDYWNSRCPVCKTFNSMQEEYAELSEKEFKEKQHEVQRRIHEQRKQHRNS